MLYLKLFLYKKQEDKRYGTNIENKILPFSAPYSTKIHRGCNLNCVKACS